ncbi:uncharacterized protein LOC124453271 [Xenia sp. Carnegie-2017]|uniref:uncharacterized protein LOC124453271 n=1 Tax=Xenia sp. Carnegie-2017 TaxID=2897299 RepID=UPI001F048FAD|nr:uncharacterized protein LOC124453271 [Xenia sp. Carnegie-2017]
MWKRLTSCFICRRETDRSSSPVKLTVSSSHDLDADSKANEENKPEDRNRVQSSTVKNNEKQVLGDVNEGAQGLESEVLRYRYTAKSSTESIDDKEAIPDPKGAHSSSSLKSKGVIDLSEVSDGSVCDKKEENVHGEINGKFSADTYFRQSSTTKAETSNGINDIPQQFHEKRHSSSKQAAENERNIDNKQEDKSLNNASHSENELLRQKQNVLENSFAENKAVPTVKKNIIPNNLRYKTDEGLTVDKNVKYEGELQDISGEKDEVSSTRIEGTISNNESHSDLVIEKFSKDLSKCIVDAVVHDSKLAFVHHHLMKMMFQWIK